MRSCLPEYRKARYLFHKKWTAGCSSRGEMRLGERSLRMKNACFGRPSGASSLRDRLHGSIRRFLAVPFAARHTSKQRGSANIFIARRSHARKDSTIEKLAGVLIPKPLLKQV